MSELLPCPFCAGEARYSSPDKIGPVFCSECGAMVNAKEWNRRTPVQPAQPVEAKPECGKKVSTPSHFWTCPRPIRHKGDCGLRISPEDDPPAQPEGGEGHVCAPYKSGCCCYQLADEPDEKCVVHGGAVERTRCACGKFAKPPTVEAGKEK